MRKFAACLTPIFAMLLAAGCRTAPADSCDGWRKLTPSAETRTFIIVNDRPFAEQVAAHNTFGSKRGCWK